jgi:hypothetical protein
MVIRATLYCQGADTVRLTRGDHMSRAEKFHHRQRLIARRRHYFGRDLTDEPRHLGRVVNTPTPCSCIFCGNARLSAGMTMQERRAGLAAGD